jgi:hypothetical protein
MRESRAARMNADSFSRLFRPGSASTPLATSIPHGSSLRQDNVTEAIRRLDPWGIDVASGVETEPGRKSREKLSAFIRAARNSRI